MNARWNVLSAQHVVNASDERKNSSSFSFLSPAQPKCHNSYKIRSSVIFKTSTTMSCVRRNVVSCIDQLNSIRY